MLNVVVPYTDTFKNPLLIVVGKVNMIQQMDDGSSQLR